MNILVTGAAGVLGRNMVPALASAGHQVFGLSRDIRKKKADVLSGKLTWREGDVLDILSLQAALENIDAVVHAAGLVSFNPADRDLLMKINGEGTANLVNACLAAGSIKKLIHISSVSCLSPSKPMPSEVDERQGFNPDQNTSDYALSKYAAEMEVCRGVEEGLPAAMLNPSIVLAPGEEDESSAALVHYASKPRLFYPAGWLNYVDARDLAEILVKVLESAPLKGERMVVNGGCIPYKDFFEKISRMKGIRPPAMETGPLLAGIAWRLAGIASYLSGRKPLLTRYTAASASRKFIYKGIALEQCLGKISFRELDDSLEWIIGKKP